MYLATRGSRPVSGRNSGTKCGLGRKRTSKTRSASSGSPLRNPKLTDDTRIFSRDDCLLKRLGDVGAKLVDIELRGIDDEIGDRSNGAQVTTFRLQRRFYRRVSAEGMRAAGLAEAAQQHRVGRFQKGDLGRNHPAHGLQNLWQFFQLRSFANIDYQCCAPDFARLHGQVGKLRDELDRQIVDAVVAQIFEGLQHRGLSRTAHAGDDDQFRRGGLRAAARRLLLPLRFPGASCQRPDDSGLHELDSSIRARRCFPSVIAD